MLATCVHLQTWLAACQAGSQVVHVLNASLATVISFCLSMVEFHAHETISKKKQCQLCSVISFRTLDQINAGLPEPFPVGTLSKPVMHLVLNMHNPFCGHHSFYPVQLHFIMCTYTGTYAQTHMHNNSHNNTHINTNTQVPRGCGTSA
jgi:NADH:ubiquinone oxidoreductase subunit F (NADH-binding)